MGELLADLTVRQVAKALWLALGAWVVLGRHPVRRWDRFVRAARGLLARPAAFSVIAGVSLGAFLLAVVAQHLSLQTSSHDFGLMDEALAGESGGRFMHTEVLGYSLLGEHFYLLMGALIPLRRMIGSPWVTVVAHGLVLWAALFPLRALVRHERVAPWIANFVCLMYACHPVAARTLTYVFHPEAAYPVCVLTLLWSLRSRRWTIYIPALLATLAIKEDAAVYLLGFAAWMALAERRPKVALWTAVASLVWLGLVLKVWMPVFGAPEREYRFIARWQDYGATPTDIVRGMLTHPFMVLADLFARQPVLCFAGLGLLPFCTGWGWTAFAVPWAINTTSVEPLQAGFALYYGAPVLAFALPAALAALKTPVVRELAKSRLGPAVVLGVALLNVAHIELPRPLTGRAAIMEGLRTVPRGEPVRVQPCLYPAGGYWPDKRPLMPGGRPEAGARWVAILPDHHPWPFTSDQLSELADRLMADGWTDVSRHPSLHLLRRPDPLL